MLKVIVEHLFPQRPCTTHDNLMAIDAIKAVVDTVAAANEGKRWGFGSIEYCALVTLDIRNALNFAD